MRRAALAGAAALALAGAAAGWSWAARPAAAPPTVSAALGRNRPPAAPARRDAIAAALPDAAPAPPPAARPASLAGTTPDGALAAGADGHLIVSPELRRAFEYWFSASGEAPEEALAERVAAEIRARLDDPAEAAALALLARFVDYRAGARALAEDSRLAGDLEARLAAVRALRAAMFGADTEALFADEHALLDFALEERRIRTDPNLSAAARAARLAELAAQAPASVRAVREAASAPQRLAEAEAHLRLAGAGDDAIRRLREERVGGAAAERLAALDAQRAAWRARVDAYRAERATIDADPALDAATRGAAVAALRQRHFAGPERLRIEALDALEVE